MTGDAFGRDRFASRLAPVTTEGSADPDRYACGVWSLLAEPGDGIAGALVQAVGADRALGVFDTPARARALAHEAEVEEQEMAAALRRWRPRVAAAAIDDAFRAAVRVGARLVTPADSDWPALLEDLGAHRPHALWLLGRPQVLRGRSVAIVGARAATSYGVHVTGELAAGLAARDILVVSGAAYGIDAAAHRGALAAGAPTVAWLAGGVDRPYPSGHDELLRRIAAHGAVISEVPCGAAPTKWRFLARNRLIAASTSATIVVEAGARSGSLNTAAHAAELGRALGAVPGPVTSAASAGCHRMLREYDAQCVTDAGEAAELLGDPIEVPSHGEARTDDRTRVLDALSFRSARDVTELVRRCGLAPTEVHRILGLLSLEAAVRRDGDGWTRSMSR